MKNTFKIISALSLILFFSFSLSAQEDQTATSKREFRKNLVIKEYKTDAKGGDRALEGEVRYNEKGYKVEEIEYAPYGMKARTTYEYDENNRCIKEVLYDDRNKVKRIRKIEYNEDGTKKAHYNYYPNGRLYSSKQFEYSLK
ncbi:hypothetical protein D0T49_06370 [Paludibacter sp. 221]|uniref:hypothetical protein n=1 Tax=Paludibacter sp. 221 TaxID=2302939 RepID=UPI0013D72E2B|nr:hypothetical protein [Paludibacter sp. 221]NDV46668.1 hypothetical protein [Paludibacter sp. 221]